MSTTEERIKQVRKDLHLSQTAFGKTIGASRDAINNVENSRAVPSELLIKAICREFDVNEQWLRTGEGEMFRPKSLDEELTEFFAAVLKEDIRASVRKRLVDLIAHLPPDTWDAIAEVAQKRAAQYRADLTPPNEKED